MDAKFVVTDSFHGTVFSLMFNKPFISIVNKGRGLTRFTSLLKLFKLDERLIYSYEDLLTENIKEIDWDRTNVFFETRRRKINEAYTRII